MEQSKSTDARDRMGVYKTLSDVPNRYRFHQYAAAYDGRDIWNEYLENHLWERGSSKRFKRDTRLVERRWKDFMRERGRHHALATPEDVNAWFADLLDDLVPWSAYTPYWVRIEDFYEWLQWHTKHPHNYHPVLMAAAEYDAASKVWDEKIRGKPAGVST